MEPHYQSYDEQRYDEDAFYSHINGTHTQGQMYTSEPTYFDHSHNYQPSKP